MLRLNNVFNRIKNFTRVLYVKSLYKKLTLGKNAQFKPTSRVSIFDKTGKITIGKNFSMGYNSELYTWNQAIEIGDHTSINDNCKIYGDVKIGVNCLFASNIYVSSGVHNIIFSPALPIKLQDKLNTINKPIIIEDDCWIGFGVVIMPGIYIGKGAVIGSNAVVTKDVFPYTINAGVPAKVISKRLDFAKAWSELNSNDSSHWPFFYRGCNYEQLLDQEQLVDGLEIAPMSVFLFKKGSADYLQLLGTCQKDLSFRCFLNNTHSAEINLLKGEFAITLKLEENSGFENQAYDQLSTEILDNFDVITMNTDVSMGLHQAAFDWKIKTIKLL